jgi:hypothetical protein
MCSDACVVIGASTIIIVVFVFVFVFFDFVAHRRSCES